jgi:hypothetical protein
MEPQRKKARDIIRRVILACDEESRQGKLTHMSTVKQSNLRIAHYTGIPVRTITRIRREGAELARLPFLLQRNTENAQRKEMFIWTNLTKG